MNRMPPYRHANGVSEGASEHLHLPCCTASRRFDATIVAVLAWFIGNSEDSL
jgi:hypothetical protein